MWSDIWGDIWGDIWATSEPGQLSPELFAYALVPLGPLSRQDAPGALTPLPTPNTYTIPFLRLANGDTVEGAGAGDFRGFVVILPAVTRQNF